MYRLSGTCVGILIIDRKGVVSWMVEDDDVELISSASGVWCSLYSSCGKFNNTHDVGFASTISVSMMHGMESICPRMCITLNISEEKEIHLDFFLALPAVSDDDYLIAPSIGSFLGTRYIYF